MTKQEANILKRIAECLIKLLEFNIRHTKATELEKKELLNYFKERRVIGEWEKEKKEGKDYIPGKYTQERSEPDTEPPTSRAI